MPAILVLQLESARETKLQCLRDMTFWGGRLVLVSLEDLLPRSMYEQFQFDQHTYKYVHIYLLLLLCILKVLVIITHHSRI